VVDIIVSTVHAMLANTSNAMLTADSREVQGTGDRADAGIAALKT